MGFEMQKNVDDRTENDSKSNTNDKFFPLFLTWIAYLLQRVIFNMVTTKMLSNFQNALPFWPYWILPTSGKHGIKRMIQCVMSHKSLCLYRNSNFCFCILTTIRMGDVN